MLRNASKDYALISCIQYSTKVPKNQEEFVKTRIFVKYDETNEKSDYIIKVIAFHM